MHVGVCVSMYRSFNRACDDLLLPVKFCCIVKDAVHDQRPVLHEALHDAHEYGENTRSTAGTRTAEAGDARTKIAALSEWLTGNFENS